MGAHPWRGVAITSAFNTVQSRTLPDHTSRTITLDAIRGALRHAGMEPGDADGFSVTPTTPGQSAHTEALTWGYQFGVRSMWPGGAPIAIPAILEAASAIASGQCETVVIASGQAGIYSDRSATAPWTRPANEFVEAWGLFTAVEFALVARRHMHLYGTTERQMAEVAALIRNNGHVNPEAVFFGKGPYTADDVLASRMIADPFHLLDCSITSEGGAAIVLTTAERAQDGPEPPIYLLGGSVEGCGPSYTYPPDYETVGKIGKAAAQRSFAMCGLAPNDVDVCEFYDPFSFELIRQFEAFGFCGEGEGGEFVTSGAVGNGAQYPLCTDGGTMSHSHTGVSQMLQKVVQAVHQLRGGASANQAHDAHVAICSTAGSGSMFNPVLLLGDAQP